MADKVTGLGTLLDDLEIQQGEFSTIEELCDDVNRERDGATVTECTMGELNIDNDSLATPDGDCEVGDVGYSKICNVLQIPTPYLMRLSSKLRAANVNFWLKQAEDKTVTVYTKKNQLVDFVVGKTIELFDVVSILKAVCPEWKIFQISHKTNATVIDLFNEDVCFDTERDTYYGGLRVSVPKKLLSPVISTIFINVNSCGIISCGNADAPTIKGMIYEDVLKLIQSRIEVSRDSIAGYFNKLIKNGSTDIPNPRHRVSLLCREHGIPERVRVNVLTVFDEARESSEKATCEDLVDLFSSMMYFNGIKIASAHKLQSLAGFVMVSGNGERRCASCDSVILPDD